MRIWTDGKGGHFEGLRQNLECRARTASYCTGPDGTQDIPEY